MTDQTDESTQSLSEELTFTLFVILPSDDVCTLRKLSSGITVHEIQGRLELAAGLPAHLYCLVYPDGEALDESQRLLIQENVRDGYILRVLLHENWDALYLAVARNNIEHVYHSGGVHLKGNIVISSDESGKVENVVHERGVVALYIASYLGLTRMCKMLLTVGVDIKGDTPFGRTALHAAAARDQHMVAELLLAHNSSLTQTDAYGHTPVDIARIYLSKQCSKKLRLMQLNLRGMADANENMLERSNTYSQFRKPRITSDIVTRKQPSRQTGTENIGTLPHRAKTVALGSLRRIHSPRSIMTADGRETLSTTCYLCDAHPNCKHSDAASTESSNRISVMDNSAFSQRSNNHGAYHKHCHSGKQFITRQGVPRDRQYWHMVEYVAQDQKGMSHLTPIALLKQKRILKFAADNGLINDGNFLSVSGSGVDTSEDEGSQGTLDPPCVTGNGAESETENGILVTEGKKTPEGSIKSSKSVRFSAKSRSRTLLQKQNTIDSRRSMRRKINIAVRRDDYSQPTKGGPAFQHWVTRKQKERYRADDDESESETDQRSDAFNDWLKRKNEGNVNKKRPLAGGRSIPGLISIGSSSESSKTNAPDPSQNMQAYKHWIEKRKKKRPELERMRTVEDFMAERQKLEERRQKLLLSSISYDEWMEHNDDRKALIRKILQADIDGLDKIEEDRKMRNTKVAQNGEATGRLDKQTTDDVARRELQLKYQEEKEKWRKDILRGSSGKSQKDWGRVSDNSVPKEKPTAVQNFNNITGSVSDNEAALEIWLHRKHNPDNMNEKTQMGKDTGILEVLRQRRIGTLVPC